MSTTRVAKLDLGMARAYVLLGEGGAVLADAGIPGCGILLALAEAGIEPATLRLAVVTHAHSDHYGGMAALAAAAPGLGVAVGKLDAAALLAGRDADLEPLGAKGRIAAVLARAATRKGGARQDGGQAPAIAVELVGGESLRPYGIDAEVVATPGHTRGSVSILVPEAVDGAGAALGAAAIVGDLVMGGFVAHGRPSLPFFGRLDEIRASLALLKRRGVRTLFTGHGGPLDAEAVWRRFAI